MSYKAVLFDLDGTLLDTIDDLADSMNSVLADMNLPTYTVAEYN
ncbi:MAG: HAD hydrolase-like protein, partial [Candidatus Latescibacteria bacterium]|nr:HAD hydrolase-like protein [Candidatus Latescibacterota bacterium]